LDKGSYKNLSNDIRPQNANTAGGGQLEPEQVDQSTDLIPGFHRQDEDNLMPTTGFQAVPYLTLQSG
jgi:hypothetical protein